MDCSPPSSSVHRILNARILESVAIHFSRESSDTGIQPTSPALADGFFTTSTTCEAQRIVLTLGKCGIVLSACAHKPRKDTGKKRSRKDHFTLFSKKETQKSGFEDFTVDLRLNRCSIFNSDCMCSKVKYSLLKGSLMEKDILIKNSFHFQEIRLSN